MQRPLSTPHVGIRGEDPRSDLDVRYVPPSLPVKTRACPLTSFPCLCGGSCSSSFQSHDAPCPLVVVQQVARGCIPQWCALHVHHGHLHRTSWSSIPTISLTEVDHFPGTRDQRARSSEEGSSVDADLVPDPACTGTASGVGWPGEDRCSAARGESHVAPHRRKRRGLIGSACIRSWRDCSTGGSW